VDKIQIAKTVLSTAAGIGAAKVVAQVIANNTNPENVKDKIQIVVGAAVIGGIVRDAAKEYTDRTVDEVVTLYNEQIKPRLNK
jgi:hypothetical protein